MKTFFPFLDSLNTASFETVSLAMQEIEKLSPLYVSHLPTIHVVYAGTNHSLCHKFP